MGPPPALGSRRTRRLLHLALLAAGLLLAASSFPHDAVSASSGGAADRSVLGCGDVGCHATPSNVRPVLEGVPEAYVPGDTYLLDISIASASAPLPVAFFEGGFALSVTDGALAVVPGSDMEQIAEGAATHTRAGAAQRAWQVVWVAPPPTAGEVLFHLAVNAVNGNGVADPLDEWAIAEFSSREGVVAEPPPRAPSVDPGLDLPEPKSAIPGAGASSLFAVAGAAWALRRR